MRSLAPLIVALVSAAAFSGCILELTDEAPEIADYVLAKKVVATFRSDQSDSERFEDYVKTRFEYRHHGDDVAPSALSATYIDESGRSRTDPFTRFTSAASIKRGDSVTIPAVNITSGLVVKQGEDVVAQRGGHAADWFTVQRVPLPILSTQEGLARYDMASEAKFDFEASGFDAGEGMHVDSVKGNARGAIDATATLRTKATSLGPRLELITDGKPDVDFLVEGRVTNEGQTYDMGARIYDDRGDFTAQGMLQFDGAHRLVKTGFGGKEYFDMRVQVWDQDHPRSANYEPEDIQHPMTDETQPYDEGDVPSEDSGIPQWAVEFLNRLWSMEIGVGDDYRLHGEEKASEHSPETKFDYILQVAADEDRMAAGTLMHTHRVSQRALLTVDPKDGGPADFDLFRSTYWISRDSHLPVYVQSSHQQTFDKNKLLSLFDFLGEEAPKDLPDAARLVLSEKTTLSLKEYSGDFVLSPVVGLMSANQGWFMGVMGAASAAFFMVSDMGGGMEEEMRAAPAMSFSQNEASDRLVLAAAESEADWNRLYVGLAAAPPAGITVSVGADDSDSDYLNEAAKTGTSANDVTFGGTTFLTEDSDLAIAGDYIEFCASAPTAATIELTDMASGSVVGRYTFTSIAIC